MSGGIVSFRAVLSVFSVKIDSCRNKQYRTLFSFSRPALGIMYYVHIPFIDVSESDIDFETKN